jgi:choline monooxygenase
VAGYPLVVLNDRGTWRGFHNVCRHRGGPLVAEGPGTCQSLVCRYHGWAYGLDGALRSARDFGDEGPVAEGRGLFEIRVEAWRGLLFVNLDLDAPPLAEGLGPLAEHCAGYPMESFVPGPRSSHHLAANWKVYAENYQEGYHIPLVHPGLNRQLDSRHYQVEVHDDYAVHRAPTRDGSVTAGTWLWRFPALALNLYPDGMCVESYAPTGPASCRVDYHFFFAPGTAPEVAEAAVASSTVVLEEDRGICEAVQANLAAGVYAGGLLSPRHEEGVAQLQRLVLAARGAGS